MKPSVGLIVDLLIITIFLMMFAVPWLVIFLKKIIRRKPLTEAEKFGLLASILTIVVAPLNLVFMVAAYFL